MNNPINPAKENANPIIRPNSNGYVPRPVDTSNVELSENVMLLGERLAGHFHDVWGKMRVDEGWAYGPTRDDQLKTNPCMVYYNDLDEEQKEDNRKSAFEALKFIASKGYTIEERKKPSMEEIVRMAWTDHGRREEDLNVDATVYVGVFGTDDPVDEKRLTASLRTFFVSLHEMFGQKAAASAARGSEKFKRLAHTRFVILSPLCTATERLAAKIAFGYGIDTYRVVNDGSGAEGAQKVICVDGDVAGAICDYSMFALAMWNGNRTGNADARMISAVERALKGSRERLMELDMPDNITVFHMLTPDSARDSGTADHKLYTIRALHPYPLETGKSWYFRGGKSKVHKTDKYNRERFERCVDKISQFNRTVRLRRDDVMKIGQVHDLMPGLHGHVSTDRDLLRHLFADNISYAAQKRRDRQTRWMMWTAIIGLSAYTVMPDLPETILGVSVGMLRPVLSLIMVLFLTAAMIIFFYQRKTGSHNEYVDFRMMAECLRVQTYWKAAGVDGTVDEEFGAKSKFDFEWARYILRSWRMSDSLYTGKDKEFSGSILHEVTRIWLGREDEFTGGEYRHEMTGNVDQYGYTRNKTEKSMKNSRRERTVSAVSIAVAYAITVLVGLLVLGFSIATRQAFYSEWFDYLAMAAGVIQVCAAGYNLFSATKDYERMVNNNNWLCIEYQKSIMACKYVNDEQSHRELLKKTGSEAVKEACGWALEFSRNEPSSPIS